MGQGTGDPLETISVAALENTGSIADRSWQLVGGLTGAQVGRAQTRSSLVWGLRKFFFFFQAQVIVFA